MFWRKDNTELKLKQMNDILKKSFSNVKNDTTNIFRWLKYFHEKNLQQQEMIKRLHLELSYMPKTREDIRRIIDDHYSFESITSNIRRLNERVDDLARKQSSHTEIHTPTVQKEMPSDVEAGLSIIEKRLQNLEQKKISIKEKIVKRLTRNSKEYVKGVMLSYIKKYGKISALQLREIMVDEQKFCSRSSFYRLLKEVEEMGEIGVIRQGKEKHYISKSVRISTK